MPHSRRFFGMLVVCLVALTLGVPRVAFAQEESKAGPKVTEEKVIDELGKARLLYEESINQLCIDAEKVLKTALEKAIGSEAIDKATAALEEFRDRGDLPEMPSKKELTKKYDKNQADMKTAYSQAARDFAMTDKSTAVKAIRKESEQFLKTWDLVPWKSNLVVGGGKKIEAGGDPISFEVGMTSEYRLEIKAKRTSVSGTMWIEFPTGDGKILNVDAIDKGNEIHVFLTVREALISADLGVNRPIGNDNAKIASSKKLSLGSKDGAFEVELVRVKPVRDAPASRKPEAKPLAEQNQEDKNKDTKKVDPFAKWVPGSTWIPHGKTGTNVNPVRPWKIVARSDKEIEIERQLILIPQGTARFRLQIEAGGKLTLINVAHHNTPTPVKNRNWSGEGIITATTLDLSFKDEYEKEPGNWIKWGWGELGEEIHLRIE